jgi:hypothetical protein
MSFGFDTHQEVLLAVLKKVDKPILEFGAGDYSTRLIHDTLKGRNIKIRTIDDNLLWLNKYLFLKSKNHEFIFLSEEDSLEYISNDDEKWGLVFIDSGSWKVRGMAVKKYKDSADYVIVHDCDYFPENNTNTNYSRERFFGKTIAHANIKTQNLGKRDYSDVFKYWKEFYRKDWYKGTPPVLLGSNSISLNDIKVNGMIISGKNKKDG